MMKNKIWLSPPHMSGEEKKYIQEAFDSNWIAPLGPNVNHFENELSEYIGVNNVAALTSGTAAIHLALIILGVRKDDLVIAPSFTFSATINPIIYQSATPILIDAEINTWNINPSLIEKAIIDNLAVGKKPKAIIVVHLYGMPAAMDEIIEISKKYNIPIIEDAAEALGSEYKNKKCGSFGSFGILSFNGNKIITTSGGGALLSNNDEHIQKARFLSTQARDDAPYYQHSQIGYNYRMSNILAGIGRGQLSVIKDRLNKRRENFNYYQKNLSEIEGIDFLKEPHGFMSNRWLTTILIDNNKTGFTTNELRNELEKHNIESRPLWKPMHLQPIFNKYKIYDNNISENLFKKGLCLPSGSNMNEQDLLRVTNCIKDLYIKNK